jgi:hypothetical protein
VGGVGGADRRPVRLPRPRCEQVCDAAWEGGIRWFDAARSYGRAEEFLAGWLTGRGIEPGQVTVSSKWGYTYTAGWRVSVGVPEVKDHSAPALARQWPETEALVGPWLRLYQVHSATLESGILDDTGVLAALAGLGVPVGVSLSGPGQSETPPPGARHRGRRQAGVLGGPGHLEPPRDLGRPGAGYDGNCTASAWASSALRSAART